MVNSVIQFKEQKVGILLGGCLTV